MAKAILRTAKLKSASAIRGCGTHNARTRPTPNANSKIKNEVLVDGGKDVYETVMQHIKESGVKRKIRANAVLAQEIFLSASPEYFRTDPAAAGTWNQKKMEKWRDASFDFLKKKYGKNLVDCRLHLDESTPHMHAIIVPIVQGKKGAKLSAKECFGKKDLTKLQDEYPRAVSHLGLERGIKGSRAKHTDVKKFYGAVNSAKNAKMPVLPVPKKPMLWEKTRAEYAEKINQNLHRKLKPIFAQAKIANLSRKKEKEYKHTAKKLNAENECLRTELKQKTDEARAIDIIYILKKFGLAPDPRDRHQWLGGGYRISVKNQKWFNHNAGQGGYGAIDLVMHLQSCDFKTAIAWLGKTVDIKSVAADVRAEAERIIDDAVKTSDLTFCPPVPSPEHEKNLKNYLANRAIDPALTDPLIKSGLIYATVHQEHINCCFLCRNSTGTTGAEIKGLNGKFSGMSKGSHRKNGGFCINAGSNKKAVFVESAIDALSYKQLHPGDDSLIISTAGATTPPEYVEKLIEQGWDITVAYDNDEAGQNFAQQWKDQFPESVEIETPVFYKDWNEQLQNEQKTNDQKLDQDHSITMSPPH